MSQLLSADENLDDIEIEGEEKSAKKSSDIPDESMLRNANSFPVEYVTELIKATEAVMSPHAVRWDRYRDKYRRGLKYNARLSSDIPLFFTNYIYSNIEAVKANLTRNIPMSSMRAKGGKDDQKAADLLSKITRSELLKAGFKRSMKSVVHNGALTGMGWFKVFFDSANNQLAVDCIAPEDVLIDPTVIYDEDARWVIHRKRDVPVDMLEVMYDVTIKDDIKSIRTETDAVNADRGYGTILDQEKARKVSPVVDVYEVWLRSYTDERHPWYILTVAGDKVLRKLSPSTYDHRRHPFVPWFDGEDDGAETIYLRGLGEVEEMESLQDRADALDGRIYKNISLVASRQRFVSAQSGLNKDLMDDTSGRTYTVNGDPSRAVYYDSPPLLSVDVFNYRNITDMQIQTVTGVFDVTQGRRPTGISSGRAIQSLQESAGLRLSIKQEALAEAIRRVHELSIQIILQYYDGSRLIKLTDADQSEYTRVIADYPDELYDMDEDGEPVEPSDQTKQAFKQEAGVALVLSDINFDYDVEVDPDSALPQSRVDRAQVAADLFRLGAIDREALLEAMDFPDRQAVLKRLVAEATGKSAGDPMTEAGMGGQAGMEQIMAVLQQMGIPPEQAQQYIQQMMQGGGQPQQGGNFPPQIAMS